MTESCPLCEAMGEKVILSKKDFRVIRVADPEFPGYFRIIWNDHIKEMSDLPPEKRMLLWETLNQVERAMIQTMHPEKINLAEFGTMVPHLHWHLIARFRDDPTFPDSYWSPRRREVKAPTLEKRRKQAECCEKLIKELLS